MRTMPKRLGKTLGNRGGRVALDLRNEKVGLKIRESEKAKVPLMVVVGDREAENEDPVGPSAKWQKPGNHVYE